MFEVKGNDDVCICDTCACEYNKVMKRRRDL